VTSSLVARPTLWLRGYAACISFALLAPSIMNASAQDASGFNVRSLKEIREKAVVMQKFDNSCAAAALATVLTYGLQDAVTERFIAARMLEKTEPAKVRAQGGFSLLDMKQVVEDRGYTAAAYQNLSIEDLKLFRPAIVPIKPYGENHYVVLNAITADEVLLADPAFGNRRMSLDEFREVWLNGLAFVVSKK
jgi:uncharacterized protein